MSTPSSERAPSTHLQPIRDGRYLHTRRFQGTHQRCDEIDPGAGQPHLTVGRRGRHHVGSGFDAIGDNRMGCPVQSAAPDDAEPVGPDPVDPSSHSDKAGGEIGDLGFPRGVDQASSLPSASVAAISRFSVAPTDTAGKAISAPFRPWGARVDITAMQLHLGAQPLQPFDVEIDRSRPDRAAAGQATLALGHSAPEAVRAQEWKPASFVTDRKGLSSK